MKSWIKLLVCTLTAIVLGFLPMRLLAWEGTPESWAPYSGSTTWWHGPSTRLTKGRTISFCCVASARSISVMVNLQ